MLIGWIILLSLLTPVCVQHHVFGVQTRIELSEHPTNIRTFCSFCCSASTTFVYLANQPHTPLLVHKYGFCCHGNVLINYTGHLLWTTCSYHKGQLHVSDSIFPLLKVIIVVNFQQKIMTLSS